MSGSHGSHGGHGGYGMGMGGRPPMPNGGGAPSGNYGNMGGLGGFMGQGMGGNFSYGGRPYSNYGGSDLGTTILNVGLGALLGSLYSQPSNTTTTYVNSTPQSTFRGYRLIEDVVTISSPIYCIGEVYRHGTDLYIGRSTDETYTTSFFATKPESEVVAHLKG